MQHDNKKQSSALFLSLHNPKGWMVGKPELIQMGAERLGTGKTALLRSNLGSSTQNAVHK